LSFNSPAHANGAIHRLVNPVAGDHCWPAH